MFCDDQKNSRHDHRHSYGWHRTHSRSSHEGAQTALRRLQASLGSNESGTVNEAYRARFTKYITDDLDTPRALALVWELVKDQTIPPEDKTATLIDFDRVLGLGLTVRKEETIPEDIAVLMHAREQARQAKNWAESDRLRDEIKSIGWDVLDTPEGQKVSKIS